MFTQSDLQSIDRNYFTVKFAGCYGVNLQSKNTRHCWFITSEDYGHFQTCTIFHTHHEGTPMHEHGHGKNLYSCMKQIKNHDVYQIIKDSKKRRARNNHRSHRTIDAEF